MGSVWRQVSRLKSGFENFPDRGSISPVLTGEPNGYETVVFVMPDCRLREKWIVIGEELIFPEIPNPVQKYLLETIAQREQKRIDPLADP